MRQAESCRDSVRRRKNSSHRDAFVFFLWHTSRHQPIAVIGGRCRPRADNLQPGTVEAGRVTPCAQDASYFSALAELTGTLEVRFNFRQLSLLSRWQWLPPSPTTYASSHVDVNPFAAADHWARNRLPLTYNMTSTTDNSNDNWKHFCSGLTEHDALWLLACLRRKNTLTYLHPGKSAAMIIFNSP